MADLLVTGAASGLGRCLAIEARRRGHLLWLVDVSEAVVTLAAETGASSLVADLADPDAYRRIVEWAPDVDVVVNNAGIAVKALFHETPVGALTTTVAVNAVAPLMLSRLYLERFQRRGRGTIVNVSSSSSYFPTPGMGPYGATKAFVTALSEALAAEYADYSGIRILAASPTGMRTDFQRRSGVRNANADGLVDPTIVARRILDDIDRGSDGVRDYGWTAYLWRVMRTLLPRGVYRRVIARLMHQYR